MTTTTHRTVGATLTGAEILRASRLRVPYEKSEVEWSPYARPGAPVHEDHEVELCRHYGLVKREAEIASRPRHARTAMPESAPLVRVAQRARRRGERGSKVPAWRTRSNLAA
jgi:hypothetical protein